ncbi:uncharacterized protein prr35 [Rhinoraja longicauda]
MSKDELTCKISAVCKHKERKPKKPHYIPRPWGKPYNYKCFQCPFTCMEKSHLYNHMKYSLCKNSLSLLIESDWPYKKSTLLNSDLRLLQSSEKRRLELESGDGVSVACDPPTKGAGRWDPPARSASAEPSAADLNALEGSDEQTRSSREREKVGLGEEQIATDHCHKTQGPRCSSQSDLQTPPRSKVAKLSKKAEGDFIITDVFSLKDSVMRGKGKLEAKLKHNKLPKSCVGDGGILMEEWRRVVAPGQRRQPGDIHAPCADASVMPCYPPPAYSDYQEPQGLNLSVLGVNYPVNHSLFSYLSPSISCNGPQVAQAPYLGSPAKLVHPHSGHLQAVHLPGRSAVPPRFFYPLLFEQTLHTAGCQSGQDPANPTNMLASRTMEVPHKPYLRKVPVVRPHVNKPPVPRAEGTPAYKPFSEQKCPTLAGEGPGAASVHHSPTCQRSRCVEDRCVETTPAKHQEASLTLCPRAGETSSCLGGDKAQRSAPESEETPSQLPVPLPSENPKQPGNSEPPRTEGISSSSQKMPPRCTAELEETTEENDRSSPELRKSSPPATSPVSNNLCRSGQASNCLQTDGGKNGSVVLINDLCKVIHEYQDVEEQLCFVVDEDTPGQKQLRGQLTKIRKELFHIRQVLEKTSKQHEGPLDLSVKKSPDGVVRNWKNGEGPEETFESCGSLVGAEQVAGEQRRGSTITKAKPSQNCHANSCAEVHKFERLGTSPDTDTVATQKADDPTRRPSGPQPPKSIAAETTFTNRATKCEADSSVPLSTEGKFVIQPLPVSVENCCKGKALKRTPSGEDQKGGGKLCVLTPFVADRLGSIKQNRII